MVNSWYMATLKSSVSWGWTWLNLSEVISFPHTWMTACETSGHKSLSVQVSFFSFSYSNKEWHLKSIHPTRPNSGWHQDKPPAPTAQDTEARWDIIPLVCSGYASGSLPTLMWPANRPQHADNSIIIALLQVSSNITLRLVKHIHIYRKASV